MTSATLQGDVCEGVCGCVGGWGGVEWGGGADWGTMQSQYTRPGTLRNQNTSFSL